METSLGTTDRLVGKLRRSANLFNDGLGGSPVSLFVQLDVADEGAAERRGFPVSLDLLQQLVQEGQPHLCAGHAADDGGAQLRQRQQVDPNRFSGVNVTKHVDGEAGRANETAAAGAVGSRPGKTE